MCKYVDITSIGPQEKFFRRFLKIKPNYFWLVCWSESFIAVHTFDLCETYRNIASFLFFNSCDWFGFNIEVMFSWNNISHKWQFYKIPSFYFFMELKFCLHCFRLVFISLGFITCLKNSGSLGKYVELWLYLWPYLWRGWRDFCAGFSFLAFCLASCISRN